MFDVYFKVEFLYLVYLSMKCICFLFFSLGVDEIVELNLVKVKEVYIIYEEMSFLGVFFLNYFWKMNELLNGFYFFRS